MQIQEDGRHNPRRPYGRGNSDDEFMLDEKMLDVTFTCNREHQLLPHAYGSVLAVRGENTFRMYESDADRLEREYVEHEPERVETAMKSWNEQREVFLAEKQAAAGPRSEVKWRDVQHEFKGDRTWVETYHRLFPKSSGPYPLTNFRRGEERYSAPEPKDVRKHKETLNANSDQLVAALREVISELRTERGKSRR